MKISDEEAIAALNSWIPEIRPATCEAYVKDMRAALAAAYTVRKARKAAKRAKAKPSILDEDPRWEKRQATPAFAYQSWYGGGRLFNSAQAVPEPAKPEWNGKFEVGKAYRTRNGRKVIINERVTGFFPLRGHIGAGLHAWTDEGMWHVVKSCPLDLVGPWED